MMWVILLVLVIGTAALWYLNRDPTKKRKLQDELDKAVQKAKDEVKKL